MDDFQRRTLLVELRDQLDALRKAFPAASPEVRKTIAADTMRLTGEMLNLIDQLRFMSDTPPPETTQPSGN